MGWDSGVPDIPWYNGDSLDDFLKIRSILEKNNIRYDTENTLAGGTGRMIGSLLAFGRPASGLMDDHRQNFRIFIDESQYEKAKNLIGYIG